jgi:Cu+-exporting ATPase
MVGTGIAAQHAILIKGADSLEKAHKINAIIFDKTGTLTTGRPSVTDYFIFPNDTHHRSVMTEDEFFRFLGSAESVSQHPIGMNIQ